ncbi:uncharacterized protein LOC136092306 [Hydra vulgaris]|uniref:Uncharacterized protein LOC136092306 n=1 Tax=Hydra vulgaris TaxID=6087 RepID=A0ABM4DNY8_HYDVU
MHFLNHFSKFTPYLPRCRQTLQKSLQKVDVVCVSGGDYIYLGVKNAIEYFMSVSIKIVVKLDIIVNIDGAPIYNSKKTSIWPILITINRKGPYAVAIWYGQGKPTSLDEYLHDFILEMKDLQSNGYKQLLVTIKAFICDAPARAFVKCIIGHSGYHSCERYTVVGTQKHGVRLLETIAPLRTDVDFKNNLYKKEGHQLENLSPLVQLNFPMITGFPLDYMHLICLGVVKKLIMNWCKGPRCIRLSQSVKDNISNELINLRSYTPSNFQRRPRSLNELEKWKATEFRFFLLYAGPVVLKGKVNKSNYDLFISLSISMHILLSDRMVQNKVLVAYAKQLLSWFVREVQILYGEIFVTYNVHSMIHLADDCVNFGESLNHLSSFPFESFLGQIKRMVHKSHQTVTQIVKQLDERKKLDIFLKERNSKEVLIRMANDKIKSNVRDRVYFIKDKGFVLVEEVLVDIVKCKALNPCSTRKFFPDYFETSDLDIFYVDSLTNLKTIFVNKNELFNKGLMIPIPKGGYAFFVLRHCDIACDQ